MRFVIVTVLALLALGGCRGTSANARHATYAPDFHYYDEQEIKTGMHALAGDVRELQVLLREPADDPALEQAEVLRLLDDISRVLSELDVPASSSNHPNLSQNLEAFRNDVADARAAASRDPPNYFLAGTVAGSCVYCHRPD